MFATRRQQHQHDVTFGPRGHGRVALRVAAVLALALPWAGSHGPPLGAADHAPPTWHGGAPPGLHAAGCTVLGNKTATPDRLPLGDTVAVRLSLSFDCPRQAPEVDVVLLVDRSSSMTGAPLDSAVAAARGFVHHLQEPVHRVAVVSFGEDVSVDSELYMPLARASQALGWLRAEGRTNLAGGLAGAGEVMLAQARPGARRVVVALTDGVDTVGGDPLSAAAALRRAGVSVYCIGLGHVDRAVLLGVADSPDHYLHAPDHGDLEAAYARLVAPVTGPPFGAVEVIDDLGPDMELVPGSVVPAAAVHGSRLTWVVGERSASELALGYVVRPTKTGLLPVNERAWAEFTDLDGVRRSYVYPVPYVEVFAPDPQGHRRFLPLAHNSRCVFKDVPIDAVLLLDVSTSMSGSNLAAAVRASAAFLDVLRLPSDRAALVIFHSRAEVMVDLTGDAAALRAGLSKLRAMGTTNAAAGLDLALEAFRRAGSAPPRQPIIVLLTDGQPNDEMAARDAAARVHAAGVPLYGVGFGPAADLVLLRSLASDGCFYHAPTPAELLAAYERIARRLVCR